MIVNGKYIAIEKSLTLAAYLESAGYDMSRIAVGKNGVIIHRGSFTSEAVGDGDTLEIVWCVGGG